MYERFSSISFLPSVSCFIPPPPPSSPPVTLILPPPPPPLTLPLFFPPQFTFFDSTQFIFLLSFVCEWIGRDRRWLWLWWCPADGWGGGAAACGGGGGAGATGGGAWPAGCVPRPNTSLPTPATFQDIIIT